MSEVLKFRIACRNDAEELARLHYSSASNQPGAFMHLLGMGFLRAYYEILLDEGSSTILCAYRNEGSLVGFAAGSIEAESRLVALKKYRLKLLIKSAQTLILNPKLIKQIKLRQNTKTASGSEIFVLSSGAHMEYWAWDAAGGGGAIVLFRKWLSLLQLIGVTKVSGEVDQLNHEILKIHEMLGAKVVKQFRTPDDRLRNIIEYDLLRKSKS